MEHKPFFWIIDNEWPDYSVETALLRKAFPDCRIMRQLIFPVAKKGETSWREASCFDSGDVKHEAERKNRVDGGGRSGVVQGAGGGSCERFRDRGDQRRLGISTGT